MPEDDDNRTTRPFWSGTITFGLVSIPVSLFPANRDSRVGLHMIGPDGRPLRRRYFSQESGKELTGEEIVRGYEVEKDKFVAITDEELERLAPEMTRDIDLRRFVPSADIPEMYFERGYFLAPSGGSEKAYRLLEQTMERTGRAGIATFVMRGKQYLTAIVADDGLLRAEVLRFPDEIRTPEGIGLPERISAPTGLVHDFEKIIAKLSVDELPRDEMHNEEAARLLEVAEKKAQASGRRIEPEKPAAKETSRPVDLLAALKQSLANSATSRAAASRHSGGAKTAPRKRASRSSSSRTSHRRG